ncbi:MAG TPA: biotin--[acetyl-CoA-carboxylase] ligase [Candidatus Poseidoniia archaeon]|nr:biotin--[acetyl-CoA-carboxylase] ligase [Candidatus Poseidoniia archaeon]
MIHIVDNLTSTNAWLSKYNSEIDDVVLSIEQSQGRGRRGNIWESHKGGFYASIVSSKHELLPFIVGISIIKVLELHCKDLNLKWPNDIIFKGKKLGGILCEEGENHSIIGIGLNLENKPPLENATNLSSHGIKFDKSVFLASFLFHFDRNSSLSSKEIIGEFIKFDCLIGNEVFWDGNTGIVKSIDFDGSLVVESKRQKINLYSEEVHLERY